MITLKYHDFGNHPVGKEVSYWELRNEWTGAVVNLFNGEIHKKVSTSNQTLDAIAHLIKYNNDIELKELFVLPGATDKAKIAFCASFGRPYDDKVWVRDFGHWRHLEIGDPSIKNKLFHFLVQVSGVQSKFGDYDYYE